MKYATMHLLASLILFTVVSALPKYEYLSSPDNDETNHIEETFDSPNRRVKNHTSCDVDPPQSSEELLNKLLALVQDVVENGWEELGIPPLDPMEVDNYTLVIPAGLIFLYLRLKGIIAHGSGDFIIHQSKLDIDNLTFDIDVEFPSLHIVSDEYNLLGYMYTIIPLYGKGRAEIHVKGLRLAGKLCLEQSEDGKSIMIKEVQNSSYAIPYLKSNLSGVVGGGNVDAVANAIIEEVILDYVNRFYGIIAVLTSKASVIISNTFLHQFDTWCYIDALQFKTK